MKESRAVSFLPKDVEPGWTLPYTALTLHALGPAVGGEGKHVYCQVDETDAPASTSTASQIPYAAINGNGTSNGDALPDGGEGADGDGDGGGDAREGEDGFTPMREIRIYLPEPKRTFSALRQSTPLSHRHLRSFISLESLFLSPSLSLRTRWRELMG